MNAKKRTIRSDSFPWLGDICRRTDEPLLVDYETDVDLSSGPPSCALISTFCLGKADELTPGAEDETSQPPVVGAEFELPKTESASGCTVATRTPPASGLALLAALVLGLAVLIRRRRR